MEQPLTVLLVEGDQEECNMFERLIDSIEDICLVGVTNNNNRALEYTKDHLPDAVILDLELHKGCGNGIAFLEALNEMRTGTVPYILVTTHNVSQITHERARQLGADFIMVKSQEDYSVRYVIDFIRSLKKNILSLRYKPRNINGMSEEAPYVLRKRQTQRVAVEMDRIGISPKAIGREYLIEAIMQKISGRSGQIASVAGKFKKTAASVERAMQNAINKAWSTSNPEDLAVYYTSRINPDRGVPTLMEFISHFSNKIKAEY